VLLLHTDLMGTIGMVSISPGVEQTAYGVFGDLVDVVRCLPKNMLRALDP
jgi:homoserine dehydrogenase